MAADKIRLGIIGANIHLGWAPRSHLPAVVASPEFELTAVCTSRAATCGLTDDRYGQTPDRALCWGWDWAGGMVTGATEQGLTAWLPHIKTVDWGDAAGAAAVLGVIGH